MPRKNLLKSVRRPKPQIIRFAKALLWQVVEVPVEWLLQSNRDSQLRRSGVGGQSDGVVINVDSIEIAVHAKILEREPGVHRRG